MAQLSGNVAKLSVCKLSSARCNITRLRQGTRQQRDDASTILEQLQQEPVTAHVLPKACTGCLSGYFEMHVLLAAQQCTVQVDTFLVTVYQETPPITGSLRW